MGRRVFRHMIDVGFIDRVRGEISVDDVLKGGVIKGEGFTGFSDRFLSKTPIAPWYCQMMG